MNLIFKISKSYSSIIRKSKSSKHDLASDVLDKASIGLISNEKIMEAIKRNDWVLDHNIKFLGTWPVAC